MSRQEGIALYVDPSSHHFLQDRLFELHDGRFHSSITRVFAQLRNHLSSKGIPVHTADYLPKQPNKTRNIYVSAGMLTNYRDLSQREDTILSAFFALESPIVEPTLYRKLNQAQHHFKRVYSWTDSQSLERFVGGSLQCKPFRCPQAFDGVHETIWSQNERKFLVMINSNKLPRIYWHELYTERLRAVEFFSRTAEIDLYGAGWDVPPYRVGKTWKPVILQRAQRKLQDYWQRIHPDPLLEAARKVNLGPVNSKSAVLGRYTLSLCFENMVMKGWITEKIFDCFFAGTVPIYLGAPDIQEYVPPECFIDMRNFESYSEMRGYLRSLDNKEIHGYKENARQFIRSPQFQPFSPQAFVDLFRQIFEEDAGVRL